MHLYNNYYKKCFSFFLYYIKMNGKKHKFRENFFLKKSTFTIKIKKYLI